MLPEIPLAAWLGAHTLALALALLPGAGVADLALIGAVEGALWLGLMRWPRATARVGGGIAVVTGVLCATDRAFHEATGTPLDADLLAHGIRNIDQLFGLYRAELSARTVLAWAASIVTGSALAAVRVRAGGSPLPALALLPLVTAAGPSTLARLILPAPTTESVPSAASAAFPTALVAPPGWSPRSVLVVVLESTRADATSAYVPTLDTTPVLARLATEGARVERAYTVLPHTTKSIVPIVCGYAPDVRRALTETAPGGLPHPCLPTLLRPLGYRTAYFKPASGRFEQAATLSVNAGFEAFVGLEQLDPTGFEHPNYLGLEERAMTQPILDWVAASPDPFFLTVLTLTSHHDYRVPSTFASREPTHVPEGADPVRWRRYLDTVRYTDTWLGELVDGLEARGRLDDTLVVVVGDHGEGHGEHGRKGHDELLYEEGIRVPLIVWGKGVSPEVIRGNRQHGDLVPSLVERLGLTVEGGAFAGRSLWTDVRDRALYFSCWYEDRCLARLLGDDKSIHYLGRSPDERFDLASDPGERSPLPTVDPAPMLSWRNAERARYARKEEVAPPEVELAATFDVGVRLRGYTWAAGALTRGVPATLTLHFDVDRTPSWRWRTGLWLVDASGRQTPLHTRSTEAVRPMYTWPSGAAVAVELTFDVPEGVATGPANVLLGIGTGDGRSTDVQLGVEAPTSRRDGSVASQDEARDARAGVGPVSQVRIPIELR